jgi:hypothetical protein
MVAPRQRLGHASATGGEAAGQRCHRQEGDVGSLFGGLVGSGTHQKSAGDGDGDDVTALRALGRRLPAWENKEVRSRTGRRNLRGRKMGKEGISPATVDQGRM